MASCEFPLAIQKVKPRIREIFLEFVRPSEVLHVFHKYDLEVLTRNDIENVAAKTKECGDSDGAVMLLDRLRRYGNWFACLLKVLEDPEIKQQHVAEIMRSADRECPVVSETFFHEHNMEMKIAVQGPFEDFVLPQQALRCFQKLYPGFMNDREISRVDLITEKKGNCKGANELLDVISHKRDWFRCLMTVLRDSSMKMGHVASILEKKTESLRREFEARTNNNDYETDSASIERRADQTKSN
ncbi:unnamed protein product, partial [Candidula unifasciata]